MSTFVLVHSPLVGPDTWESASRVLRESGHAVVVPVVDDDGTPPFWEQHVGRVVGAVTGATNAEPLTVVAHSGAGQLVAHIGAALDRQGRTVDAFLLVDAGTPPAHASRLAQLREESPELAEQLESLYESGEGFPNWTQEWLTPLVPDPDRRRRLVDGVRKLPMDFWQETIPAVPSWSAAPCGVLLLSGAYEATAQQARDHGWALRQLDVGNHFFMLVEPETVARELVGLRREVIGMPP